MPPKKRFHYLVALAIIFAIGWVFISGVLQPRNQFDPKKIASVTIFDRIESFTCRTTPVNPALSSAQFDLATTDIAQPLSSCRASYGFRIVSVGFAAQATMTDGKKVNLIIAYQGGYFCVLGEHREYFNLTEPAAELLNHKLQYILENQFLPARRRAATTAQSTSNHK